MNEHRYNVAIRTVGKAGDKFVKEIESLKAQTISPNRIVVYIAEGFDLPPRVADEEYVVVPKGLVHQRAVVPDDDGVDYLLVLDDDVFVPMDAVEQMVRMMEDGDCDCIIPDTFPSHRLSLWQKVIAYMSNNVSSRKNDGYAVKIKRSGAFSYNASPPAGALLPTQSGAGPAFFIKKSSFQAICYHDEYWVDTFPAGTFYEDQLMFYKMYVNGVRMKMWFGSGVLHLDAGTNNQREKSFEKLMYRSMANYVIWHRSVLMTADGGWNKMLCYLAFAYRFTLGFLTRCIFALSTMSAKHVTAYVKGLSCGVKYVTGDEYRGLPDMVKTAK